MTSTMTEWDAITTLSAVVLSIIAMMIYHRLKTHMVLKREMGEVRKENSRIEAMLDRVYKLDQAIYKAVSGEESADA